MISTQELVSKIRSNLHVDQLGIGVSRTRCHLCGQTKNWNGVTEVEIPDGTNWLMFSREPNTFNGRNYVELCAECHTETKCSKHVLSVARRSLGMATTHFQ